MREKWAYHGPMILGVVIVCFLWWLPTGFEGAVIYQGTDRCAAEVLTTNESRIIDTGLVRSGEQICTLKLLGGRFQGRQVEGVNMLAGSLEADKIFVVGDKALVVIHYDEAEIRSVSMIDHYRLGKEAVLAALFALVLMVFAGRTGIRAMLSFAITVLMLWKVLVPCYLKGFSPVGTGLLVTLLLIVITMAMVYGFDWRMLAAVSGSADRKSVV